MRKGKQQKDMTHRGMRVCSTLDSCEPCVDSALGTSQNGCSKRYRIGFFITYGSDGRPLRENMLVPRHLYWKRFRPSSVATAAIVK